MGKVLYSPEKQRFTKVSNLRSRYLEMDSRFVFSETLYCWESAHPNVISYDDGFRLEGG